MTSPIESTAATLVTAHKWAEVGFVFNSWLECEGCGKRVYDGPVPQNGCGAPL